MCQIRNKKLAELDAEYLKMQKAYAQLVTEKERKEVPLLLHVGRYALEEFTTSLTVLTSICI